MYNKAVASAREVYFNKAAIAADEQIRREKSFFSSLRLPNGTRKSTAPARLGDVDRHLAQLLRPGETVDILDVGISSGVTTLELLDCLHNMGHQVRGVGVDICVRAYLRSFLGIEFLLDPEGAILQVATPLFARGRPDDFFARGRPGNPRRSMMNRLLAICVSILESPPARRHLLDPGRSRAVSLVSPRLLDRGGFTVIEHDVALAMKDWNGKYDVIRCANILNLAYFSESALLAIIENMISWLKIGGILLVCRTSDEDSSNHGSYYCKQGPPPGLRLLQRIGRGSELEPLIRNTMKCTPEG